VGDSEILGEKEELHDLPVFFDVLFGWDSLLQYHFRMLQAEKSALVSGKPTAKMPCESDHVQTKTRAHSADVFADNKSIGHQLASRAESKSITDK
jgi:hypothetical protein